MKPLETRKQLLIVESELNRAQLIQEWQEVRGEVRALVESAQTVRSIATAVATLLTGLTSCRRPVAAPPTGEKPSWWQTLLKGAGVVSTFWSEFRGEQKD